ncbi:acyl-CoA dehydrogenase family protein [Saccharopolyspora sp. CA-218241]|uniref:acyl-CoA dehydrogenase family protein n=1 Tax=Saccharopolyspora sp. CA-218241 TaxID=3240027 RepID=UPI003D969060
MTGAPGLDRLLREVVGPGAAGTDARGRFPRAAVTAFGAAGVLGLTVPKSRGGGGGGLAEAVRVVSEVARHCGSTAAVLQAHYAAVAVLVRCGPPELLRAVASGTHLCTAAVAEAGRPEVLPTGAPPVVHGGVVDLVGRKRGVVAAGEADGYVWASAGTGGAATLWWVPATAPGLHVPAVADGAAAVEGIGLRGSAMATVTADPLRVPASAVLGGDGGGAELVLTELLPWSLALAAAVATGLVEAVLARAVECVTGPQPSWTRWQGPPTRQPEVRADLARMAGRLAAARSSLDDAVQAATWRRPEALRLLLQARATAGETAVQVAELGIKVCGQSAFRADLGVERCFRDAHAAGFGPFGTDDALDLLGRLLCDVPLLT